MLKKPAQILLAILLLIAIIIAGCKPKQTAGTSLFAKLSELKGKVGVQDAGESQFIDATVGAVLNENGQIETGEDGRVRLDFSTGTLLRLGPGTLFTLISNQEVETGLFTRIKLEAGRLFIILKGGNVEVETPSGVAAVRGSYLMVEVDPLTGDVLVTCLEGDCSASNDAGTLNFTDGQKTVLFHKDPVTGKYRPPSMEWMTDEDFQKWLNENPEAAEVYNRALATLTAMAGQTQEPTQEATSEPTQVPTEEPTDTPVVNQPPQNGDNCIQLVYPADGSNQNYFGEISFDWESSVQAAKYVVIITYPNGTVTPYETTETSLTRYLESMPPGGDYTWSITALDQDGRELCHSNAGTFTKPEDQTEEERKKKKEKREADQTQEPACSDYCNPSAPCYDPYRSECLTVTPCSDYCNPSIPECYDPMMCFNPPPTAAYSSAGECQNPLQAVLWCLNSQ